MARHNQAAAVELDLVGHELARRHTPFPVPVIDNATLVPPAQAVDSALDTSPHGESQGLLDAFGLPARIFHVVAESFSRLSQGHIRFPRDRMVTTKHASRVRCQLLEPRHGLANIVVAPKLPRIPKDVIPLVVNYWAHVGDYPYFVSSDDFDTESESEDESEGRYRRPDYSSR